MVVSMAEPMSDEHWNDLCNTMRTSLTKISNPDAPVKIAVGTVLALVNACSRFMEENVQLRHELEDLRETVTRLHGDYAEACGQRDSLHILPP